MKNDRIFSILARAALFSAIAVGAQEPPPGPPPDGLERPGHVGRMGPGMELLGFEEMLPGKVVTGSPYIAVATLESAQTLADGNTINRKVDVSLFRDSQGRTRREITLPGASHTFVMIHDPATSSVYVLHPDTKTAEKKQAGHGQETASNMQSRFEVHVQKEIAEGILKKEDLGTQSINGVIAQGTRYVKTIPAGQDGNERPIVITTERWVSSDMQVLLKSTHSDPRQGQTAYTVTTLQRQEPVATMFTVPADYTVTQGRGSRHGHHNGGPPPSATPAN